MKFNQFILNIGLIALILLAGYQGGQLREQSNKIAKLEAASTLTGDGFEHIANDFKSLSTWRATATELLHAQSYLALDHEARIASLESGGAHNSTAYRISDSK